MEVKPIPWIKREDMEWVDGRFYLATEAGYVLCLPMIVRDFGNGYVESITKPFKKYSVDEFTHYAIITDPV